MHHLISLTPDPITRFLMQECLNKLRRNSVFHSEPTLLYDQFGRLLPRVTTDHKIGDTIHVQKPQRFVTRAE